ncbi:MAG TPA: IPT/TIG domain-containing protein [Acidimicrobiales bacterium]|nr:IPT/TIG domain-containing protein [Acidimicrobiales bacterium]
MPRIFGAGSPLRRCRRLTRCMHALLLVVLSLAAGGLALVAPGTPAATASAGSGSAPASQVPAELPLPANAGSPPNFRLTSWHLACPTTTWCLLTGIDETESQLYLAVVDTWSSGTWSSQLLPVPGGAVPFDATPEAVTCTAASQCTIVGVYYTSSATSALVDTLSGSTWSETELTSPPTADPDPVLSAVSCASATFCVAVGENQTTAVDVYEPIVAVGSGTSWSIAAGPESSGMTTASLTSVACPSTTSCVAVGSEESSNENTYGLIDTYSSVSGWSAQEAAVSGGLTSPGKYYSVSFLDAVTCPAAGTCFAAGWFDTTSYAQYPLVDKLVSGTWSGINAGTESSSVQSALVSISCASTTECAAAGSWNAPSNGESNPLFETWNGSSWALKPGAEPSNAGTVAAGDESSTLDQVSCASTTCVAAGNYETSTSVTDGLIDTIVPGSSASALASPEPSGATSTSSNGLMAVACPSSSTCIAAGTYPDANGIFQGMIDSGSGSSYSATELPAPSSPPPDPSGDADAVACASSGNCVALASYTDAATISHGAIETETAGSWSEQDAPIPSGQSSALLGAVTCPAAGSCVAVGEAEMHPTPTTSQLSPLVEVQSGSSWTALTVSAPSGSTLAYLSSVSCPAVGTCAAVGRYYLSSSLAFMPLVVWLSGGTLTESEPSLPANGGTYGNGIARFETGLWSVSCASTASCVAVGMYADTSHAPWGLIESGSGSSWTATEAPQPSNAAGESSQVAWLHSVSCPAAGTCYAVGYYMDNAPAYAPLVDSLSSGSWAATTVPLPSNAAADDYLSTALDSISCADATDCSAVGIYADSNEDYWGLVESLSGGTWSALPASDPPGGATNQDVEFTNLSCASAGWCVGTGVYRNTSDTQVDFLVTGSGSNWTWSSLAVPANSSSQQLGIEENAGTVGCAPSGDCVVPGDYYDSGPDMQPFADTVVPPAPAITSLSPGDGPAAGGTTVTLDGSNFFPATTATVGGTSAALTYVSPTAVEVQTPAGFGSSSIELTTDGGDATTGWTWDPAPQQVSFTSSDPAATYGGSYAPDATATSGLAVTYAIDPASQQGACSEDLGTVSFTGVGTCIIDADQAGNSDWAAASATQQLAVGPASQSIAITSTPASPVYGSSYDPVATASSGLAVSFSIDSSSSAGACSLSGPATAPEVLFGAVGTCVLDADQSGDDDYQAAPQVSETIPIGAASQSISFTSAAPASPTYGGSYAPAASASSGLPVSFSIDSSSSPGACSLSDGTVGFTGVGTCVIDADQSGNSDWSSAPEVRQSLDIAPASQSVTLSAAPVDPTVNGSWTPSTGSTSGLPVTLALDPSSDPSACSEVLGTVSFTGVGSCVLDATQQGDSDWSPAAEVTESLTVGPASQSVTFTSAPPGGASIGGSYRPTAVATSGLPVSFSIDSSSTHGACSYSGVTLSLTGAGSCVLDAVQAGGTNYTAAPSVSQTVRVTTSQVALSGLPSGATTVGSTVELVATVTPPPAGGSVSFSLSSGGSGAGGGSAVPGCADVQVSSGEAGCDLTTSAAGDFAVLATFSGAGATGPASTSSPLEVISPVTTLPVSIPGDVAPGSQITVTVGVGGDQPGGESAVVTGPSGSSLGPQCPPSGLPIVDGTATCTFPADQLSTSSGPHPSNYTVSVSVVCRSCSETPEVTAGAVTSVIPPGASARHVAAVIDHVAGGRGSALSFGTLVRLHLRAAPGGAGGRVRYSVDGTPVCSAPAGGSCEARLTTTGRQVVLGEYDGPLGIVVTPVQVEVLPAAASWHVAAHRTGTRLSLTVVAAPSSRLPVTMRPRGIVAVRDLAGRLLGTARLRPLPGGGSIATWSGVAPGEVRVQVHHGSDYAQTPAMLAG